MVRDPDGHIVEFTFGRCGVCRDKLARLMSYYPKLRLPINLYRDAEQVEKLFQLAVREALIMHKRIGNPIATWKNGKVVIVPPEEIEIPPDPFAFPDQPNLDAW